MPDFLTPIDLSFARLLVERGGPIVVILAIMSVFTLAVALLKVFQFITLGVGRSGGVEEGMRLWREGAPDRASAALARQKNPTAHVLTHAMNGMISGFEESTVREDAERLAHVHLATLRAHLRVLEATAQVAPLLGLFGTVVGMMSAFQALQSAGAEADPAALAGGIWVALITTAVGLSIAIPAGLALYWFDGRIEREAAQMEDALTSLFTGRLTVPARPNAQIRQSAPPPVPRLPNAAK